MRTPPTPLGPPLPRPLGMLQHIRGDVVMGEAPAKGTDYTHSNKMTVSIIPRWGFVFCIEKSVLMYAFKGTWLPTGVGEGG